MASIMKHALSLGILLVLIVPVAARADLAETPILLTNSAINLDTGAIVNSGGDLLWNGSTLTPQGAAGARSLAGLGARGYNEQPESYFVSVATAGKSPITAIAPGNGVVVRTNGGNISKVLIIQDSDGAIGFQFTTFGVSAAAGVPLVTGVLNNSSNTPVGFPSYGIAPSSLFIVTGSGLADPGNPVLQDSSAGLPLTLNGASITVVLNGVTTHPALYYTSAAQLAAVLPAATPVGTGALTVTYRGVTSAPAPIVVVPSAMGINSYYGALGVATDAGTGDLLTYTKSGFPGQTIVLWTTGLGADPADSDTTFTSSPHAVKTPLQIYIGDIAATILYQGSAGYPGVNQINVVIPPSVLPGCLVSVVAVTGSFISNTVTIPVNKGGGVCVDQLSGQTGDKIPAPSLQTLRTGVVTLVQTDSKNAKGVETVSTSANAAFEKYTLYGPGVTVSPGGCIIDSVANVPVKIISPLDAGSIVLTGPNGLSVTLASPFGMGSFNSVLASGAIPASGGTFTFQASGGADVGAFTVTMNFSPILVWTNSAAAATIDRSKDFTVTWTGGNPGTHMYITGTATSLMWTIGFTCSAAVDDGEFTIPSYIFAALPVGRGGIEIQNDLSFPLTATGLDTSEAGGNVSHSLAATYQ
jgi:uncharacterized protein (TIGR03437 family)